MLSTMQDAYGGARDADKTAAKVARTIDTPRSPGSQPLTLVFGVNLSHQGDVSLQVERQRLDGVQVILYIVHHVSLVAVGRV